MEDNVRVNKLKGQRKVKKSEPVVEKEEQVSIPTTEESPVLPEIEEPKEKEKPKAKSKEKEKVKEVEEYDVERQPDIVIHKKHKGVKPRKIIVITGDSDLDSSDEDIPYRARPNVEIKKKVSKSKPVKVVESESSSEEEAPAPPPKKQIPRKQNVGYIAGKPEVLDAGKGLPQQYANKKKPEGFIIDSYIDSIFGLTQ